MPQQIKEGFEQHVQTVLTTLVGVVLIWTGSQILDYQSRLVRLEEQLSVINKKLDVLTTFRSSVDDLRVRVVLLEKQSQAAERRLDELVHDTKSHAEGSR